MAAAYARANYWAFLPDGVLFFRPWRPEPAPARLHHQHKTQGAALISASNPYSVKVSEDKNRAEQMRLRVELEPYGPVYVTEGAAAGSGEKAERSFLVFGIALEDALKLGRKYKQHAIVYTELRRGVAIPQLKACQLSQQKVFDTLRRSSDRKGRN
ncbi:MAG: DUF3293 domain-containing protein [Pseudomonadota bacterium]|nr:DUF3293 domain-containing protein [Pseudomonadota bacterium]